MLLPYLAISFVLYIFNICFLFLLRLYYTKVKLGTPPTEFKVQIDTGSDILWVTCNSCMDCPQSSELGVKFITLFSFIVLFYLNKLCKVQGH